MSKLLKVDVKNCNFKEVPIGKPRQFIDVTKYGIVGDGDIKNEEKNTERMVLAIASHLNKAQTVYFLGSPKVCKTLNLVSKMPLLRVGGFVILGRYI